VVIGEDDADGHSAGMSGKTHAGSVRHDNRQVVACPRERRVRPPQSGGQWRSTIE
jgi:hypothetical protein